MSIPTIPGVNGNRISGYLGIYFGKVALGTAAKPEAAR